jgi:queuine tRNA-ribosyltransferase
MDEKPSMTFSLLGSAAPVLAPRVGQLSIPGRKAITTPHHVPLTSRGTVPHIAHDVMRDHTAIGNLYIGLEDCKRHLEEVLILWLIHQDHI